MLSFLATHIQCCLTEYQNVNRSQKVALGSSPLSVGAAASEVVVAALVDGVAEHCLGEEGVIAVFEAEAGGTVGG